MKEKPFSWVSLLKFVVTAGLGIACLLTIAFVLRLGLFPLVLLSNFQILLLVGLFVLAALALFLRQFIRAGLAMILVLFNTLVLYQRILPVSTPAVKAAPVLKIFYQNVLTSNRSLAVIRQLKQFRPDLVMLVETDQWWINQLRNRLPGYKVALAEARPDNFGLLVLSRGNFKKTEIMYLSGFNIPTALVQLEELPQVHFLLAHPLPPKNRRGFEDRNRTLTGLGRLMARQNTVLLADLNVTAFSPWYAPLKEPGIRHCATSWPGLLAGTWPANFLLRIPIDFCLLHGSNLKVRDFKIGPENGSDHLPLMVELVIPGA